MKKQGKRKPAGFAISIDALLASLLVLSVLAFVGLGMQAQETATVQTTINLKQVADDAFTALDNSGILVDRLVDMECANPAQCLLEEAQKLLQQNVGLRVKVTKYAPKDECKTLLPNERNIETCFDTAGAVETEAGEELPPYREIMHGRKLAVTKSLGVDEETGLTCGVIDLTSIFMEEAKEGETIAFFQNGEPVKEITTQVIVENGSGETLTELECCEDPSSPDLETEVAKVTMKIRDTSRDPLAVMLAMDKSGSMAGYDMGPQEISPAGVKTISDTPGTKGRIGCTVDADCEQGSNFYEVCNNGTCMMRECGGPSDIRYGTQLACNTQQCADNDCGENETCQNFGQPDAKCVPIGPGGDPCTLDSDCDAAGLTLTMYTHSGPGHPNNLVEFENMLGTCTFDSDCDDSNPCTNDTCSGGQCTYAANSASCDDGIACTENDYCSNGTCQPGTPNDSSCPDRPDCATKTCNVETACNETAGCQYSDCAMPAEPGQPDLLTGLAAHYEFDEGSGQTASDSSGNGNHGTLEPPASGPLWETACNPGYGNCLDFDGLEDYVDLDNMDVPAGSGLTISMWINADTIPASDTRIISKATGSSEAAHWWMISYWGNDQLRARIKTSGGTTNTFFSDTTTLPTGQWLHIAITFDETNLTFYRNGANIGTRAHSAPGPLAHDSGVPAAIAVNPFSYQPFDGLIDEVRIYNQPLDAGQISDLYAGLDVTNGLVSRWAFEEGSGNTAADSTNGNHGTLEPSAPKWETADCISGNCLSFDGANDYVATADIDIDYITIRAWVKADSGTRGYIVNKNFNGSNVPFSLNVGGNTSPTNIDGFAFYPSPSWCNSGINTDIRGDGKLHHIAGTYDGTNLRYYVDGVLDSSSTECSGTLPQNNSIVDIGRYANDSAYFGGLIDEVKIYDRALSSEDVLEAFIRSRPCTLDSDCDDGKPCTADTCSGGSCQNSEITECVDGDGCCPAGCPADLDCIAPQELVLNMLFDDSPLDGIFDSSIYGNHGTCAAGECPMQTENRCGSSNRAYDFDGGDEVNLGNSPELRAQLTGDLTISFWAKPSDLSSRQNPICKIYGGEFCLTMETSGQLSYYHGSSGATSSYLGFGSPEMFEDDTWVHVVITRDNATRMLRSYKNGVYTGDSYNWSSSYDPSESPGYDLRIGAGYASNFEGVLDQVKIYDRVLSENEIFALYYECPPGETCDLGEVCGCGQCIPLACTTSADCPPGETCINGGTCQAQCITGCGTDLDCLAGEACCSNSCVLVACNSILDCSQNELCINPGTVDAECVPKFANQGQRVWNEAIYDGGGYSTNPIPFQSITDYYAREYKGYFTVYPGEEGLWQFAIDSDDASVLLIDGTEVVGWYGFHGWCDCWDHSGTINLAAGSHEIRILQEEHSSADNMQFAWRAPGETFWETDPNIQGKERFLRPGEGQCCNDFCSTPKCETDADCASQGIFYCTGGCNASCEVRPDVSCFSSRHINCGHINTPEEAMSDYDWAYITSFTVGNSGTEDVYLAEIDNEGRIFVSAASSWSPLITSPKIKLLGPDGTEYIEGTGSSIVYLPKSVLSSNTGTWQVYGWSFVGWAGNDVWIMKQNAGDPAAGYPYDRFVEEIATNVEVSGGTATGSGGECQNFEGWQAVASFEMPEDTYYWSVDFEYDAYPTAPECESRFQVLGPGESLGDGRVAYRSITYGSIYGNWARATIYGSVSAPASFPTGTYTVYYWSQVPVADPQVIDVGYRISTRIKQIADWFTDGRGRCREPDGKFRRYRILADPFGNQVLNWNEEVFSFEVPAGVNLNGIYIEGWTDYYTGKFNTSTHCNPLWRPTSPAGWSPYYYNYSHYGFANPTQFGSPPVELYGRGRYCVNEWAAIPTEPGLHCNYWTVSRQNEPDGKPVDEGQWNVSFWSDEQANVSMQWFMQRIDSAKIAAMDFINTGDWKESDQFGLVSFNDQVLPADIVSLGTGQAAKDNVNNALRSLEASGGTATADAIERAHSEFFGVTGNISKYIVLLTDGRANVCTSSPPYDECPSDPGNCCEAQAAADAIQAAELARDDGITVYVIGFADESLIGSYEDVLKQVAKHERGQEEPATNPDYCNEDAITDPGQNCGKYYFAGDAGVLEEIYALIAGQITAVFGSLNLEVELPPGMELVDFDELILGFQPGVYGVWDDSDPPGNRMHATGYLEPSAGNRTLSLPEVASVHYLGSQWFAIQFDVVLPCDGDYCDLNYVLFPPETVITEQGETGITWGKEAAGEYCDPETEPVCEGKFLKVPFLYSDLQLLFIDGIISGAGVLLDFNIVNIGYKDIDLADPPKLKIEFEDQIGNPIDTTSSCITGSCNQTGTFGTALAGTIGQGSLLLSNLFLCKTMPDASQCSFTANRDTHDFIEQVSFGQQGTIIAKMNQNQAVSECSENNESWIYCGLSEFGFFTIDYYAWVK